MKLHSTLLFAALSLLSTKTAAAASGSSSDDESGGNTIVLEDFLDPTHKWSTMNDPVMGGQSKSSLKIENGVAKFTGTCAIVPFLKAPGFITIRTGGGFFNKKEHFPDVSSCSGLAFTLKSNVDYDGYRISFGNVHVDGGHHAYGYKAGPLKDLPQDDFAEITIPFKEFSAKWDDATGDITVTCADDEQYCPGTKWLSDMQTISFWGEGVEGEVDLEIKKIVAVECTGGEAAESKEVPRLGLSTNNIWKSTVPSSFCGHRGMSYMVVIFAAAALLAFAAHKQYQRKINQMAEYENIVDEEGIHGSKEQGN